MKFELYIGTRKSRLALIQTQIAAKCIQEYFPEVAICIRPMSTQGDKRLDQSLTSFGGKGVFTQELEAALLSGDIDMAIHSAKDMPMDFEEGTRIGAVFPRADVRDMVVTRDGTLCKDMKKGSVIGTGSLRRQLQLKKAFPDMVFKDVRGNVKTRLQKLLDGQYDALVLAAAGLARLRDWESEADSRWYDQFHYEYLDTDIMLPAAGQAIIAAQIREPGRFPERDEKIKNICQTVTDQAAWLALTAEREFLKACGGSCNAPAAAYAFLEDGDRMALHTAYAHNGQEMIRKRCNGIPAEPEKLGQMAYRQYETEESQVER